MAGRERSGRTRSGTSAMRFFSTTAAFVAFFALGFGLALIINPLI
jgi:hypothetical protein